MDNEKEASTQIISKNIYPSIQEEQESLDEGELSVSTDKNDIEQSFEKKEDIAVQYSSSFIRDLKTLIDKRAENIEFFSDDADRECDWVNLRYRCLVESILTLSEMRTINLDDLKEICNAFTDMIRSDEFENLPEYYPYSKEIKTLWQSIKNLCLEADEEKPLNFKIKRSTRLNLLATRWELAHFVKKESFNQLNFEE